MKRLLASIALLAATLAGGSASAQTYRTIVEYDAARRPIKVTDPLGNVAHTFYNANGQIIRQASQAPASQWLVTCTTYSYTGQSAQVLGPSLTASKDTCPSGTDLTVPRAEFGYDGVDRLDNETVRLNPGGGEGDRVTRTRYDAAGQVLQVRRAVGSGLEQAYATYSYTANGRQEFVIDANGNRARLTWDGYDRQSCWIFPSTTLPSGFNPATPATALATAGAISGDCVSNGDYEGYGYDNNGNLVSLRKRDSTSLAYIYDGLNRVTSKAVPVSVTGAPSYSVFYGYDLRGAQTFARFVSATGEGITNVYDKAGRLTSSSNNMGGTARTLTYLYDKISNRTRVTHPGGAYFAYAWDELNRLDSISENGSVTIVDPQYDVLSRRTALTRGGSTTAYGYDGVSRLGSLTHDLAGAGADLTLGFTYNRASQVVSRTQSNDLYANTAHYNINRPYTRNGLNQYTQAGSVPFTHDLNGNVRTDGANTFTYDGENRLTAVSGNYSASLVYDPMGRLYQTSGGAVGTTRFLYDGDALVAEYDGSDNLIRRYVHGSGADEPLIWYEGSAVGSANRRQLYANHQGSLVATADANGVIIATNAYDAWGIANATNLGRFAYTGQIAIPEAGIYHYKARAYSPTLGRFMQTDPVGYADGMTLYAYAGNDPVNARDPSGMAKCPPEADDCIETPESAEEPSLPPSPNEELGQLADIVVLARKAKKTKDGKKIPFGGDGEKGYHLDLTGLFSVPIKLVKTIQCTSDEETLLYELAGPGEGQIPAHLHRDVLANSIAGSVPGPGDHRAASGNTKKMAVMFTRSHVFGIESFSDGRYRVSVLNGDPLEADQRSRLIQHMQMWESPVVNAPQASNKKKYCP